MLGARHALDVHTPIGSFLLRIGKSSRLRLQNHSSKPVSVVTVSCVPTNLFAMMGLAGIACVKATPGRAHAAVSPAAALLARDSEWASTRVEWHSISRLSNGPICHRPYVIVAHFTKLSEDAREAPMAFKVTLLRHIDAWTLDALK